MKEHLAIHLILIVIQRVVHGIVELDEAVDATNSKILFAPAEGEGGDFALLGVGDGFLGLGDQGLGLEFLLMLGAGEEVEFDGGGDDALGGLVLE